MKIIILSLCFLFLFFNFIKGQESRIGFNAIGNINTNNMHNVLGLKGYFETNLFDNFYGLISSSFHYKVDLKEQNSVELPGTIDNLEFATSFFYYPIEYFISPYVGLGVGYHIIFHEISPHTQTPEKYENNFSLNFYFVSVFEINEHVDLSAQISFVSLGTNYKYSIWQGDLATGNYVEVSKWVNLNTLFLELGLKFKI